MFLIEGIAPIDFMKKNYRFLSEEKLSALNSLFFSYAIPTTQDTDADVFSISHSRPTSSVPDDELISLHRALLCATDNFVSLGYLD